MSKKGGGVVRAPNFRSLPTSDNKVLGLNPVGFSS